MISPASAALVLVALALIATGVFVVAMRAAARARRKSFFEALGAVVRIGTPCRLVSGRALLPGSIAMTPTGLFWDAVTGAGGSLDLDDVLRLETDESLSSGRRFFRAKVLRVTPTEGDALEFVLAPGAVWEWRRALGEWAGTRASPSVPD